MGFNKEEFDESLKYYKNNDFTHENLVRDIRTLGYSLATRAAACVADDPDDDSDWDQEAYEEYDQQWFVNTSLKVLENRIVDKTYIREYRIAAANELHRRVVESSKESVSISDVVDVTVSLPTTNTVLSDRIFRSIVEADKPNDLQTAIANISVGDTLYVSEADKQIPYVPADVNNSGNLFILGEEYYKKCSNIQLEAIAEKTSLGHYPDKIIDIARTILLERYNTPKPKHPDVQRAIDNYPSCNHYSPNWE